LQSRNQTLWVGEEGSGLATNIDDKLPNNVARAKKKRKERNIDNDSENGTIISIKHNAHFSLLT